MMKVALIGTGVYGIALASEIYKKTKNITMWTESQERYEQYLKEGRISGIIDGYCSPKSIKLTMDYKEAVSEADVVLITSTAAFVGSICREIKPYIAKRPSYVSLLKVLKIQLVLF